MAFEPTEGPPKPLRLKPKPPSPSASEKRWNLLGWLIMGWIFQWVIAGLIKVLLHH